MARSLAALLRTTPLPAGDASVIRTVGTPFPAVLTDRATGAAIPVNQWRKTRDALVTLCERRADRFSRLGFQHDVPPPDLPRRIRDALGVAEESALVDVCTRVRAVDHGRYVQGLSDNIDPVLAQATRLALQDGVLWTPLWELLFERRPPGAYPWHPLAYVTRVSERWMSRIQAWLATAERSRVEELLVSKAPPLHRTIAAHVPLGDWSPADRWRLVALGPGPHGTGSLRALWENPSWTTADRVAFLADAMKRLTLGHGVPGVATARVSKTTQDALLFDLVRTGWESADMYHLADAGWTARWLALLATDVLPRLDAGNLVGRCLFMSALTPAAVITAAMARWRGTGKEHPGDWVANAHVPLAYVQEQLDRPPWKPAYLFQQVARHPGAIRDSALRARLLASRSTVVWRCLWATTPAAERGAYLARFLKVAPIEALEVLTEDPTARSHATAEMVLPLFTHRTSAIRAAAFTVLTHLQPQGHEPHPIPTLPVIRRAARRPSVA